MNGALAAADLRGLPGRVRLRWRLDALLRGVTGAVFVLAGSVAVLLLCDIAVELGGDARAVLRWLPLLLAALPLAAGLRRAAALGDDRRAALLVEEREPALEHLLTTTLEADLATPVGRAIRRRATERLGHVRIERVVPWTFGRRAGAATGALLIAGAVAAVSPGGLSDVWARWAHPAMDIAGPGAAASGTAAGAGASPSAAPAAITAVELTVEPPAYTGLPPRTLAAGGLVTALPGSRVTVRARASGGALTARRAGGATLAASAGPDGWTVAWTLEPGDRGVDLALRAAPGDGEVIDRRVVPIALADDRPPDVALELPDEDVVVAAASGVLSVRARAVDDFGVGGFGLHWVRSSGSGESFSFDEGRWTFDDVAEAGDTLVGTFALDLAETGMGPGDVLHVRAEARDRNDVTGPGLGVSATRLVRVADPDALDEVTTLVGFPIEREREPLLSQRMIILLTEELIEERDTLTDAAFRARASSIADEQDRLRERVEEAVFVREAGGEEDPEPMADPGPPEPGEPEAGHDHDGNPVIAVNEDMLAAFNAMWDASRLLRQAEPVASLPPQRVALERLQRMREAERVFARGRVTRPPLDLGEARGTGEVDEADPLPRSPGEPASDGARWRGEVEAAGEALDARGEASALALRLQGLAADLLAAADGSVEAAAAVEGAARRVADGDRGAARALLAEAAAALAPAADAGAAPPLPSPSDGMGAAYLARVAEREREVGADAAEAASSAAPFVFATARYGSGDWDSAPLVPSNLAHSIAQYTDLPVDPEGAIVDLSDPELMRYPFVFLTGHLPVRLDEEESEGLVRYVERGGFVFIDDHNHDIDGAFHRSVVAELARLFGPEALQPLPEEHELYHSFFRFEDGPPVTGHEMSGWGDGLIHRELFAVMVGGRIGVLYSNKDYASEWSYHAENKRFLARDNTRFGVNVILYALTR